MNIYVPFEKPDTLKEFLEKFFDGPIGSYSGYSVQTFKNKECTYTQCRAGKRRSLNDIFHCVNTYFPNTTLNEICITLFKLKPAYYLYPEFCSDIGRNVVCFYRTKTGAFPSRRGGKYAWYKILTELNITSMSALYSYKENE